ncbi:MAG: CoA pyrophosphatase [Actinomycetota bacterium]
MSVQFDGGLRDRLTEHLGRRPHREQPLDGRRHAAVGLLVIDSDAALHGDDPTEIDRLDLIGDVPGVDLESLTGRIDGTAGGAAIVLTRRGAGLRSHTNQWALPGGRLDPGETAMEASIREIAEEIGVTVTEADLLGRLDDYPTRSGYVISPFVYWAPNDADPVANPDEVASVHRVALTELRRSPRFVSIPESERPVIQVPVGGDLIHAPTGAIIHQFHAVAVEGLDVTVDQYEQPVFAWK